MKKGDIAFFYHSNCKEPGIVGTMEIVREHSPDCKSYLTLSRFPAPFGWISSRVFFLDTAC